MYRNPTFGDFEPLCQEAELSACNLFATAIPRSCELSGFTIGSNSFRNLGDVVVCVISAVLTMLVMYRTHTKSAAVGRKEMNVFMSFYLVTLALQIVALGGFLTPGTQVVQILSALHIGFLLATFWTLFLNGLVGYQYVDDGSLVSVLGVTITGFVWAAVGTVLSMDVVNGLMGNIIVSSPPYGAPGLFGVYLLVPLICALGYLILQTILVAKNLGDQKPLVNLYLAALFFVLSQIMTLVLNQTICTGTNQSVDGSLFATVFNLAAVIFVYRFWDSITEDDWDNVDDIFV